MIKAVLFDLDGTLVNSLADLAASTNYALEQYGFPTHNVEKYKYFVGNGMQKLIERVLPEDKRDIDTKQKVFDCFINHYRKHYADKTVAYDGIFELLESIKNKGIKIAVITNKAHEMAETIIDNIFGDMFEIVFGKKEGYPPKPEPSLTLKLISDLGVTSSECMLIGDSGVDIETAKNAKLVSVGVLWGFRTRDELASKGADYIVSEPTEIIEILKELSK